jgi:hypothetical protein
VFAASISILLMSLLSSVEAVQTSTPAQEIDEQAVPAGTVLQIRLRQTLSSFGSRPGTPVSAIVVAPVESEGRLILPRKAELRGTIQSVRRVGLGLARETARLHIEFDSLIIPNGRTFSVKGQLAAVDDSRESVDADGRIHGIRATASFSSILSGLAISAAAVDPMMLGFAASSSLSVFRIPESEIIFPVGTELRMRLNEALILPGPFPAVAPKFRPELQDEELTELVRRLPFRTETDATPIASDLTSLLYIGSEGSITRAFDAAGWARADALSTASRYNAMRAVLENQGYRHGPMSTLLLNGEKPNYEYSKTLNTFFKRHHLRIYRQPSTYRGVPVWTSTATHDSGVGFSRAARTMIHLIDENIDDERSKVVNDLTLTGCVDAVHYMERPWVPLDASNATGDALITDGQLAILVLNDCESADRADIPDDSLTEARTTESAPLRPVRDAVLALHNALVRGNIGYQAYSGIRAVRGAFRKSAPQGQPRTLHLGGEEFRIVPGASVSDTKDLPDDPGRDHGPSFQLPGERQSSATILDFSISGGHSGFGNSLFSTQPVDFTVAVPSLTETTRIDFATRLHSGWVIAPRVTLNSWNRISNEFGFTYNRSELSIAGADADSALTRDHFRSQIRQFTYNTLLHLKPNGSRFRPYVAAGPVLQLIRTVESKPTSNRRLRLAVKDLGIIVGAYEFGSKPPLEGGGIFQFGLQYGAGFKVQLSHRLFLRTDFRETLSRQPDFWTKSYPTLRELGSGEGITVDFGRLQKHGPLRLQLFSTGFGIAF